MSQKDGILSKLLRIFTGPAKESAPETPATPKKTCVYCEGKLTGRQRRYCSKNCASKDWQRRNPEKVRAYSKAYHAKKKAA